MAEPATLTVLTAAFVAGGVDAIVGGGGLIQLPALVTALPNAAPPTLLGTSKLAGLAGTASAAARYARHVAVPWRTLLPAAALAALASLGGSVAVGFVPARLFRPLVPVALCVVLGYTLAHRDLGRIHAPRALDRRATFTGIALVAAIGFYDGFFGPGTGSFLMLLFVRYYGFDFLNASAAARLVNVGTNAISLAWFASRGSVLWPLGLSMAVANVAGAQFGARVALRRGAGFVRVVFVTIVSALIAKTAWDALVLLSRG
ncbi:MAG TPA: TSUP family transporter [Steroidobacteraceae bacterium]|nr:TSUP family transporter [Steroidobacteraceae bacterium]